MRGPATRITVASNSASCRRLLTTAPLPRHAFTVTTGTRATPQPGVARATQRFAGHQFRHAWAQLREADRQPAASVCFVDTSQLLILEKKRVSEMDVGVPARACTASILVLA